ncbi:hypothetical protein GCM10009430_03780 [Aquimarina litoralis]|uniref:Uncharacterized protein n=1 Tax=Aquimarina litoralis TaxID=584605 RepID=A0ABP3TQR4_9FLAO
MTSKLKFIILVLMHATFFYLFMSFNLRQLTLDIVWEKLHWHILVSLVYGVAMAYLFKINLRRKEE